MTQLEDVDSVKRWLRERREAANITQEELGFYMGESARAVLNAERVGSPKHQLPRGYAFFRMLKRLGVVVPDAPVPAGPSLHDRLQALEGLVQTQGEAMTSSLDALAKEIRALERRRERRDGRANEGSR